MSLTKQSLDQMDWILSDLKNYRFDDATCEALQNACYIIRQLNSTLGGGVNVDYAYDVLNINYLVSALQEGTLDKPG